MARGIPKDAGGYYVHAQRRDFSPDAAVRQGRMVSECFSAQLLGQPSLVLCGWARGALNCTAPALPRTAVGSEVDTYPRNNTLISYSSAITLISQLTSLRLVFWSLSVNEQGGVFNFFLDSKVQTGPGNMFSKKIPTLKILTECT